MYKPQQLSIRFDQAFLDMDETSLGQCVGHLVMQCSSLIHFFMDLFESNIVLNLTNDAAMGQE